MSNKVDIDITQRGFQTYDAPWQDTYGHTIKVYESSAASGPHVWLSIEEETVRVAAHLDVEQAKKLRRELKAFIDESKTRWQE